MGFWDRLRKSQQGQQGGYVRMQGGSWVREVEHTVLRVISLGLSLASALAIRWLLSPFDVLGPLHVFAGWVVAVSFGGGGYFLSRGVAHRLMNKESVWLYLPFFVVVEFVEIFSNFALAVSVFSGVAWLGAVPGDWRRDVMMFLAYLVLSIIPLASAFLAVSDMDLERKNQVGSSAQLKQEPLQAFSGAKPVRPVAPSWGQSSASQSVYGAYAGNGGINVRNGQRSSSRVQVGRANQPGPLVKDMTEEELVVQ